MLTTINRMAHARQVADVANDAGNERFRFGIFFYRTAETNEEPEEPVNSGESNDHN